MPTVLIIDDCKTLRTLASYMLLALGVTPILAENGKQALEICAQEMPDAILLDWNMPIMDGPSFHKHLKALAHPFPPKLIYCTIEDEFDKIAKAMSAGADAFIIKPFNLSTLSYNLDKTGVLAGAV